MATTNDEKDRFILRFHTADQRKQLKIRAINNSRSMNAELLYLIQRGIETVDGKAQEVQQ